MSIDGTIAGSLPEPVPTSEITITRSIDIQQQDDGSVQTVYTLPKAPFIRLREVTAVVNGVKTDLSVGDTVVARDTNNDGQSDAIAFVGVTPRPGTTAEVVYDIDPIIGRYASVYNDDIDSVGETLDTVFENKSVETASSQALDLIGTQFGRFGTRSGRPDGVYRSYLRSVVPSFAARGTISDIKFAVSAATGVPEQQITVEEYTDDVEIAVVISSDVVVDAAAQLSQIIEETLPPGVALRYDPIVRNELVVAAIRFESLTETSAFGLGSATIGDTQLGSLGGYQSLGL